MDLRFFTKSLLLILFLVLSNPFMWKRICDIESIVSLFVFLLVSLISVLSFLFLAFHENSKSKLVFSILIIVLSSISLNYYQVTNHYLEFYELETMLHAINNWSDALFAFDGLWYGLMVALLGGLAIFMPLNSPILYNKYLMIFPSILTCVILISILYLREGDGTKGMPTQYTGLAYSLVIIKDEIFNPLSDDLPEINVAHTKSSFNGDLIVVVDESIRGDFLDINNANGVATSLLEHSMKMVNFGIAASATNCSDTTNLSLRRGVRRSTYLHDKNHNPSLWQFAKKAGYRTVYLDAQLTQGRLGNHMTEPEKEDIDYFYQVSDSGYQLFNKDNILANQLIELLNNETRDFIYINKMGAHFPYEGKYPSNATVYSPVMQSVLFDKSYPEEDELPHPDDYSELMRLKFINSYKNAVSWNVTNFFKVFTESNKSNPYVMMYTSDHGQSFHDDGREGYGTHCSIASADPEEGVVPFLILSNEALILDKLKIAQKINKNKVSHFNMAPTLYDLMGYDLNLMGVQEKTIFEPLDGKDQLFLSKYFVRFGSQPIWNSIDMQGRDSLEVWNMAAN
ncbi:MAG: glucan phosphoethanolaminetransferase (alkaline phosphatase superfamily) [Oceanicoccus sp.]|jgi:glucan phosphoethanolaminetransferase (alkaline phosphatase superfamily)